MSIVRRWVSYVGAALLGAVALLVALATPAAAEEVNPADLGQTPSGLAWIDLTDSRGIPLWNFEMSLDRGSLIDPAGFFWASIVDACWGIYRSVCALALWFIDWVLSLTWMDFVAAPLLTVGDAMQSVLSSIGLVPTFLSLTALLAGIWMIRGKTATAIFEVAIACVIAALASGVFAQPVRMVAGPDGLIVNAAQTGQGLAAELVTGDAGGKTSEQLRKAQTGQLVDVFIRQPTQIINFGQVLDGTQCEGPYNDVVTGGPYGPKADIRNRVGECNEALGKYAAEPSAAMALGSLVFMPSAFVILLFGAALGGAVITAAVRALYQSLKAIVTLITGLLPGGGRGSLLLTVAEVIVSMLMLVFVSIFMAVFLLVVESLFTSEVGGSPSQTFIVADIFIVAGLVVFWRQHQQIQALSRRMADWMAHRPGGSSPTRLPDRQPGLSMPSLASVARTASVATHLSRAHRDRPSDAAAMATAAVGSQSRPAPGNPGPRNPGGSGGGSPTGPGTGSPPGPGSGSGVPGGGGGQRGTGPGGRDLPPGPGSPQLPAGPGSPGLPPGRPGSPQLPAGPGTPGLPPGRPGSPQLPAGRPGSPQLPAGPSAGRLRLESAGKKSANILARAGAHAALAYATGGASTVVTGMAKTAGTLTTARRAALASRMAVSTGRSAASAARRAPAVMERPQGQAVPVRAVRPAPVPAPASSPPSGKGVPRAAGKGAGRAGNGPGVTVLRPGDPGYLTPREALAAAQGRRRSTPAQPRPPRPRGRSR